MRRIFKYTAVIFLILAALIAGFLLTFDLNRYKDDIVHAVEARTGRKVAIQGKIGLGLSLVPTVVIRDVTLGNASWGNYPAMLRIHRFEAGVALLPLLGGDIRISHFVLDSPQVFLETDKQGRGNWLLGSTGNQKAGPAPAGKSGAAAIPPSLSFHSLLVKDAQITYRDGRTGKTRSVTISRLSLKTGGGAPLQLQLAAEYEHQLFTLDGGVGSLDALLQNRPYPVDLKGRLGGADLTLKGKLQQPLKARGVALKLAFSAASLSAIPVAGGKLPAAGPLAVSATLSDPDSGVYQLKPLQIKLADGRLDGEVRVDTRGGKPAVSADLRGKHLDLAPLQSQQKTEGPLFSKTPLPVSALNSADADVNVTADEVLTRSLPLQNVKLGLTLHNGRLHLVPLAARIAGGTLSGDVAAEPAGGKALALRADVNIKGLMPGQLPSLKKYIRGAATDVALQASGQGGSVSAIMGSLNGHLLARAGKGELDSSALKVAGSDVLMQTLSLLKPDSDKPAMNQLQCMVAAFRIKQGVAVADSSIAMETPQMTVVGGGVVNLGTEKLDLGLQPHPREGLGISASQFAEVVRLGGTLSHPVPKTDTLAAMKTAARVGAAVATGGLSILAGGLFERATADSHPCDTAAAYVTGKQPASTTATTPASTSTQTKQSGTNSSNESVGDKLKGALKGLFGN